MKQKPVISVIIPAYNEEDSIEKTLISLKNQKTKVPYEIIVCDNNSTDKTFKIAK
ncbi:MAG: glycosyltransferase family A protein, partial [Candidatus Nanoarchaeia archaeon]|nr:glycosyltransferase family A protein [Candidatus Nanoarchaeia archaeon]